MAQKTFQLLYLCEPIEEDESFFTKRMFGGMSVYLHGKMVMCITESPGDREWRGEKYDFDIWNGLMLPTDREHHSSLQKEFKQLVSHPVLGKWLYLPLSVKNFEVIAEQLVGCIAKNDVRFGILPGQKTKKKKSKKVTKKKATAKKATAKKTTKKSASKKQVIEKTNLKKVVRKTKKKALLKRGDRG